MLIAIDGIDGAGKTTLANRLKQIFSAHDPIIEKEPTEYSEWGRKLRETALSGRLTKSEELEFFHKDRVHHIERIIKPALEKGGLVILDRYVDSTLAFQADDPIEAEGLYQKFLPEILVPDITFILDCPVEIGLERIAQSRGNHTEFEKVETLERARRIYSSRRGPTYFHLDASGTADNTLKLAIKFLYQHFASLRTELVSQKLMDCADPPISAIAP